MGQNLADRMLLEVGCLIPEFTGGDIELTIPVDVANSGSFVVVSVELLDAPFDLRRTFAFVFAFLLRGQCLCDSRY